MEDHQSEGYLLRDLAERIALLEDNVAFLELWCEEQQDALDRMGEPVFFYDEEDDASGPAVHLRIVDLREPSEDYEETDHDRKVRALRTRIHRLRNGLPAQSGAVVGSD